MAETIQVNDIGTVFELTITDKGTAISVSSATTKKIVFKKPKSGDLPSETFERDASFTTDGTDGKIEYTTVSGDIDRVGTWYIQAKVVLPDFNGRSEVKQFVVSKNI